MVELTDMLKKLQQMQQDVKKIQEELRGEIVTTGAGKGAVVVTMNGEMEIKALTIDPKLAPMDNASELGDMVKFAVNEAVAKARALNVSKFSNIAGGLNMPGLPGMPGR